MDTSSSDLSDPPSSPLSDLTTPNISPRVSLSATAQRPLSPPSTIPSGSASPMKHQHDAIEAEIRVNPDGPPPAKRRRTLPKQRTTEYLNLRHIEDLSPADEELLDQLTSTLKKKKKIVVIAGAGISVSAGIPDFRSSHGLFATLKDQHKIKASGKHLFDASVYKHDSSTSSFHTMVRELADLTSNAKPTAFHHLIASLSHEGRLQRLYTQNVDCLDTSMEPLGTHVPLKPKGPFPKTIQLHGGLAKMVCSKCSEIKDFDGSLFDGPNPPLCQSCVELDEVRTVMGGKRSHGVGRMRPRMVLYNEFNPDEEAIANVVRADLRARPDAVIVVGTSMKIPGVRNMVKDMCQVTRKRKDGVTAWINLEPEPSGADLKDCWDLVVRAKCDQVASLAALPRFDQSIYQGEETIMDNDQIRHHEENRTGIQVELRSTPVESEGENKENHGDNVEKNRDTTPTEAKPKSIEKVQGIPTPTASPHMRPKTRTALPTAKGQSKAKQSELSFKGAASQATTTAPAHKKEPKKPTQRKTKQTGSKLPTKPKSTITTTFKATKAVAVADSKMPTKLPLGDIKLASAQVTTREDFDSLRPKSGKPPRESLDAQVAIDTQLKLETTTYSGSPMTPTATDGASSPQDPISSPSIRPLDVVAG